MMSKEEQLKTKCPRCQMDIVIGLYVPKEAYQDNKQYVPDASKQSLTVKDAEILFDPDIAKNLTFTMADDDTILVKPIKFLGKETFWKLLSQVKSLGGNYVSQKKNSYFYIPAKQRE
jgi:hypothetical protein